jgi:hypothetical protein
MGKGSGVPAVGTKAFRAEQARLARFFQAINKHRKALELAIEENFGGSLDPAEWRAAFESSEPRDANRTMVVTGDHSAMLNAYVEIRQALPALIEDTRAWLGRHGVELR